jgi:hypothetical protein
VAELRGGSTDSGWAPFMELSTFEELVAKARAKGHLV